MVSSKEDDNSDNSGSSGGSTATVEIFFSFCNCAAAECLILQGIRNYWSNSTREDSQTESVGIVAKCWCSEL